MSKVSNFGKVISKNRYNLQSWFWRIRLGRGGSALHLQIGVVFVGGGGWGNLYHKFGQTKSGWNILYFTFVQIEKILAFYTPSQFKQTWQIDLFSAFYGHMRKWNLKFRCNFCIFIIDAVM